MTIESLRRWSVWVGSSFLLLGMAYILLPHHIDRVKVDPRESSAVARLRLIVDRQNEFRKAHCGFADSLSLLRDVLTNDGHYVYALDVTDKDRQGCVTKYLVKASPAAPGKISLRYFSVDESATTRFDVHPIDSQSHRFGE